jgi:hypothetical protein
MPKKKFVPPIGKPFSPPEPVFGRTGGSFVIDRKREIPKPEPDDEEESTVPLAAVTKRFSRMR